MSKMKWHQAGERRIEAGVSDVALYTMGTSSYNTGVAWNGITAINENPSGADVTDLYADNIKYASMRAAEKFGFTVEAFTYPDEWAECDGSAQALAGVYVGQQPRKAFGLVYKSNIGDEAHPGMDTGFKLHIIYNSTCSPSSRGYTTINDNPDAISFSWEANSTPVDVKDYKATSEITVDSTKFIDSSTHTINAKLQLLLDTLYGRDADQSASITALTPTLVDPDTVLYILDHGTMPST